MHEEDKIEEKSLEFNVSIDKFIPDKLMGDEKRIKQCVVNLLKNAIKYTDEGSISINVFGERISKEEINIFIEINDTGIGIKNEDIDYIFNSFNGLEKTINRTYEGTGLGLTIVKNLINLMDGNLQIQSEYGIGSTFVLNFPQNVVQVGDDSTFVLIEGEQSKIENKLSSVFINTLLPSVYATALPMSVTFACSNRIAVSTSRLSLFKNGLLITNHYSFLFPFEYSCDFFFA